MGTSRTAARTPSRAARRLATRGLAGSWRPAAVESILAACGPFQHELLIGEEQVGAGGPAAARSAADALAQAPGAAYLMAATPEAAAAALAAVATCPEVSAVASWTGRAVDVHFTTCCRTGGRLRLVPPCPRRQRGGTSTTGLGTC